MNIVIRCCECNKFYVCNKSDTYYERDSWGNVVFLCEDCIRIKVK